MSEVAALSVEQARAIARIAGVDSDAVMGIAINLPPDGGPITLGVEVALSDEQAAELAQYLIESDVSRN